MPEGPEIKINSLYVNNVCQGQSFSGHPIRSEVSKNPKVMFGSVQYSIHSESRGKELALILTCQQNPNNSMRLLFRFGMSGKFRFTQANDLPKHSHLIFTTATADPPMALTFVDTRRFGTWQVTNDWGSGRGPDPMDDYSQFCSNIEDNIDVDRVFDKPICEVLLNQKYFNGIGNYLRAEILYRAGTPPFSRARDVLLSPNPTILELCHTVPLEVVCLKTGMGKTSETTVSDEDYQMFMNWLRCYANPSLNNLVDHNNRTIWFQGEAGPLVPKVKRLRRKRRTIVKSRQKVTKKSFDLDEVLKSPELCNYHSSSGDVQSAQVKRVTRSMSKGLKLLPDCSI